MLIRQTAPVFGAAGSSPYPKAGGVTFASGDRTISFTVPVAFYRDRKPDPYTGLKGDATFPRYIFLASYGWRFGGPKAATGVATSTAKPCN